MKEDFLHYLWRAKRFDLADLRTTQGEPVEILQWGEYNRHAGPDFQQTRLRIGETLWAGSVEMHLRASEWLRHRHQDDDAYRNVVLHVVLEEDVPVHRPDGDRLPCLELRHRIAPRIQGAYLQLLHNQHWIPCQKQFHTVPESGKGVIELAAVMDSGVAPTSLPFRASTLTGVVEVEPNNGVAEATAGAAAGAFDGVIGAEGDVDFF
ncbi:MAG TPA: DUF2851 family protein, partial [Saprospiraceae bacterium]|nr:DUF2851 family protein [Saprospiraceae bacterium]